MDDAKRQRRFQFSLRKLMLWMALWAVYLTFFVRWVGLWFAIVITLYLALIAIIRMKFKRFAHGFCVAAFGTGLVFGCLGGLVEYFIASQYTPNLSRFDVVGLLLFLLGFCLGSFVFVLIHGLVRCVNFLDDWMQTRTPNR